MSLVTVRFNVGDLYLIPGGANPTPIKAAVLEDLQFTFSRDGKPLRGQYAAPIDYAFGSLTVKGKGKLSSVHTAMMQAVAPASTRTTGHKNGEVETGTIPDTPGPYTITVSHSANFTTDLGVVDTTTGQPLKCVASAPATGQYSYAAGVYTFAAADKNHSVQISYEWNDAATGSTVAVTNALQGAATKYVLNAYNTEPDGTKTGLKFYSVVVPELGVSIKAGDWGGSDLSIEALANAAGQIFDAISGEVA